MIEISQEYYDTFITRYTRGCFRNLRVGQAFHNFMELHKCTQDKEWCDRLWNMDGRTAFETIKSIVRG